MKLLIATLALIGVSRTASADTDFKCVNDCTSAGSLYAFCQKKCSYESPLNFGGQPTRLKQIDWACQNRCQADGYSYNFCQSRCSD